VEVVVAIAISTLILTGTAMFASRALESVTAAKAKGNTYQALSDAVSRLGTIRSSYPLSTVVTASGGYSAVVFTNSGQTAGVIVGVVNGNSASSNYLRLDPVSEYFTYDEKVLAVQDLGSAQVASVLASTGSVYSMPFYEGSLYRGLVMERFQATPYNSGALVDAVFGIYDVPRPELDGQPKSAYPEFPVLANLTF
jgi:hypothetical protein